MRLWYEKLLDNVRNAWDKLFPLVKKAWSAYGYYISLACLLMIFGLTAYMYRTRDAQPDERVVSTSDFTQAMARVSATAEPTPAPTPYVPVFNKPLAGEITCGYSANELIWNDTLGQWIVHNGIDISANAGTVITASEDGVISALYADDIWGNVIEITHDDGWVTRYCSLETLMLVEIGQTVAQGDVISSVGISAIAESSEGAHLHFEMLQNGEYKEPEFK